MSCAPFRYRTTTCPRGRESTLGLVWGRIWIFGRARGPAPEEGAGPFSLGHRARSTTRLQVMFSLVW